MFSSDVGVPGLGFSPTFLSAGEQAALLSWLSSQPEGAWSAVRFRGVVARRRMLCFGWDYVATGRSLRPTAPMPPELAQLRDAAACVAGLGDVSDMQQLIINAYPAGAGIGAHIDAAVFGDPVVGISVGGVARLRLCRPGHATQTLELPSGALYVFSGEARHQWTHQVLPVAALRYALTFRRLARPG